MSFAVVTLQSGWHLGLQEENVRRSILGITCVNGYLRFDTSLRLVNFSELAIRWIESRDESAKPKPQGLSTNLGHPPCHRSPKNIEGAIARRRKSQTQDPGSDGEPGTPFVLLTAVGMRQILALTNTLTGRGCLWRGA